ncbi:transposable element Tc1 transposase [Trichonephila clavipes]|nr:transposable element Tc1 transposase [Trichonephila clavipes]
MDNGRFQRQDGSGRPRARADQDYKLTVRSAVTAPDSSRPTELSTDPAFIIAHPTGPQPGVTVLGALSFDSRTSLVIIREHVWDMMGRRLHRLGNVNDLARQLEQIWQVMPQETIRMIYHSMPRCVVAFIQTRGGSTPY